MSNTMKYSTRWDPYGYFPLKNGNVPASSVKMEKFTSLPYWERKVFQMDGNYYEYIKNKRISRTYHGISRFYRKEREDISEIIEFMCQTLSFEWPDYFNLTSHRSYNILECFASDRLLWFDKDWNLANQPFYLDAFDAIAMQVPEDLVVCKVNEDGEDFVSHAHLTSASGWTADWAVGKSFKEIHEDVLKNDGSPVIKRPKKVVEGIIKSGTSFQRVGAISFRSGIQLNLHPDYAKKNEWTFDEFQDVYLRVERQTVTSFKKSNMFLFTIKSYFSDCLDPKNINSFRRAIENLHEDNYAREFLSEYKEKILKFLDEKE